MGFGWSALRIRWAPLPSGTPGDAFGIDVYAVVRCKILCRLALAFGGLVVFEMAWALSYAHLAADDPALLDG
jgi:hypothetical protein